MSAQSAGDQVHAEGCWTEVIRCYEQLIPIRGQAWLYASPSASASISKFMTSLEGLIDRHLQSHDTMDLNDECRTCLKDLKKAGVELSGIAREHLKLEKLEHLKGEEFEFDAIFSRSFVGRVPSSHRSDS